MILGLLDFMFFHEIPICFYDVLYLRVFLLKFQKFSIHLKQLFNVVRRHRRAFVICSMNFLCFRYVCKFIFYR